MSFVPLASDCAPGESAMLDEPWLERTGRADVLNITYMLEGGTYCGGFECTWPVGPKKLLPVIRVDCWPGKPRNEDQQLQVVLAFFTRSKYIGFDITAISACNRPLVHSFKAESPDGFQPSSALEYYCSAVGDGLQDAKGKDASTLILDWVNEDVSRRYMELIRRILAAALQKINHIESSPSPPVDPAR